MILISAYPGTPLRSSRFPKCKNLIHTGFNSIPGTLKYLQLLVYANPNFQTNRPTLGDFNVPLFYASRKSFTLTDIEAQNQEFRSRNNISDGDNILVVGDPNSPATFAYGRKI
jgi:hypothetical protein